MALLAVPRAARTSKGPARFRAATVQAVEEVVACLERRAVSGVGPELTRARTRRPPKSRPKRAVYARLDAAPRDGADERTTPLPSRTATRAAKPARAQTHAHVSSDRAHVGAESRARERRDRRDPAAASRRRRGPSEPRQAKRPARAAARLLRRAGRR
jgi:hypothetical protein